MEVRSEVLDFCSRLIIWRLNSPFVDGVLGYLLGSGCFDDGLLGWILSVRDCLVVLRR